MAGSISSPLATTVQDWWPSGLNGGAGSFVRAGTYASSRNAWAVAAADINGDGVVDLLTAHRGRQQLAVLIGIGDGRFHGAHLYAGPGASDVVVGGPQS